MGGFVAFVKTTAEKFATITKDDNTFYRVSNGEGEHDGIYLGSEQLNKRASGGGGSAAFIDDDGYISIDYDNV